MKNEEKILELLTESLKGQDHIVAQLRESDKKMNNIESQVGRMVTRLDVMESKMDSMEFKMNSMDIRLGNLETRTNRIEDQMVKLNLQTVENTRAIFKLAEKVEQIAGLTNRVTKLEKVVYK